MPDAEKPTISIITATYNAAHTICRLIDSLAAQTEKNFEWVVADGASADQTLNLIREAKKKIPHVVIDSRPDFGIYDALNRAIKIARGEYYIVVGADDFLAPNAVEKFQAEARKTGADFISASVTIGDRIIQARPRGKSWLYGQFAYITGHAVSLAIRRSIHGEIGYYSRKYPIAADQLFILSSVKRNKSIIYSNFIAGEFDCFGGTSGRDILGSLTEMYRIQVECGHSPYVQTLILFARILKNWKKIHRTKVSNK